ncbi:hypothetical protein [Cryobacterium sp. Hb1]|uniref:hypothetical protein n=1 Tax=Cryobacterium sp. Hb1 TaxID=1259147 RepID=UPI00106B78FC|nr:hypothetical protein [Cryobacterium sp. Hb1]TFD65086.1 hypothetical protein E3T38_14570 [Cryobacterium sp. Hb1]
MKLMLNRKKAIIGAGGVAVALTMALAALGPTGAYFSDTAQGEVSGTVGSIKIAGADGTGTDSLNLAYTNLLPGTTQTVASRYVNTGLNAQDVWVVFNDKDALHALNDLGTYGEFHVAANGKALFDSANLSDDLDDIEKPSCGTLAPTGCWPVPKMIKLESNLAPTAVGSVSFTFGYAAKMSGQSKLGGGVWNSYPVKTAQTPNAVGAHNGLPYQLVATQVGQKPGK